MNVAGIENLPAQGGALLAINHLSRLDGPLIFALLPRPDITGLVSTKYQKNPIFRWLINQIGAIWLNREEADVDALRTARNYLRNGGGIGIAPEGTRSQTGQLIAAKTGAAFLADKAGVPVVPVAIWGTENAVAQVFRLQRPHIFVRFGEPFLLPPLRRQHRDADLQHNTDLMM
ncbi:MAG TPA: lysophospholipid acyltransferase family protein, partial [Anaerolineales bacterium]|nr:lysophospholipid acyltransferase family protein [Anaerolineales bacterium]